MSEPDPVRLTQALHAVVVAIWHDIDQLDGSGVSDHFTPDGTLSFGGPTFAGRAEIDSCYAARAGRGRRVARHITTNLHVITATPRTASTVSTLLLFAQDGEPPRPTVVPTMVGDVIDEFVLDDDRWLIRSRRIATLFVAPDTELAVPTS